MQANLVTGALLFPERGKGVIVLRLKAMRLGEGIRRGMEAFAMGAEPDVRQLLREIKSARDYFETHAEKREKRLSDMEKSLERVDEIEHSINEILVGQRRPGSDRYADDRDMTRKSAIEMCRDRHSWLHQKNEGRFIEYMPSSTEVDEATTAQKAWRAILRHGDLQRLDDLERKSLSSFQFRKYGLGRSAAGLLAHPIVRSGSLGW